MPDKNYSLTFTLDDDSVKVTVIHIDTTTLAPEQNKLTNQNGGISYELQQSRIKNQMSHLKSMLDAANSSRPDYLIVSGHYPVVSKGEHGDISSLVSLLHPLFKEYEVDLYVSGHDHIGSHLTYENIHYDIFGAGSMTSTLGNYNTIAELHWAGVGYSSFGVIKANQYELTVSWYDINTELKYSHTLSNKHLRQKYDPKLPEESPEDNNVPPIITPPHKPPKSDDDSLGDETLNKIPGVNNTKPHGAFAAAVSVLMILFISMTYYYITHKSKYKRGMSKSALSFFPKRSPRTKSHQVLYHGELYKKQVNPSSYSNSSLAGISHDSNGINTNDLSSYSRNEAAYLSNYYATNYSYEDLQHSEFHESDTISDITTHHQSDSSEFYSNEISSLSNFHTEPSYTNAHTLHTLIQSQGQSLNRLSNLPKHNRSISDNIIYNTINSNGIQHQHPSDFDGIPANHSIDILPRINLKKHRRSATSFI